MTTARAERSDALLRQLERDAEAESQRRVEAARAESDRLREDARSRAAASHETARAARIEEHRALTSRTLAEVRTRTAGAWLTARAEALERVFAASRARLEALAADPRLVEPVTVALRDAVPYLPEGVVAVRHAARAKPVVDAAIRACGLERVERRVDDSVPAGIVVETADGSTAVDATFAARVARERGRLSVALAHRIEGEAT